MSRPLRIEYPGALHHVMNRRRRGEDVFSGKDDNEIFVALLKKQNQSTGPSMAIALLQSR